MNYTIEIASADYTTTKQAVEGGADRIELCAALCDGGTTPSYGTIKKCIESFDVPIFPIIRTRGGDFLYTEEEFQIMVEDITVCKQLGCAGVVIGLLNNDGTIDVKRTAKLVQLAYPMDVTFHRAFDRCSNPFDALEALVEIGVQRILTSGQKPTAPEGVALIAELVKAADHRIVIMPGSGVRKENIKELMENTGAAEFHSSLRSTTKSNMQYQHPSFSKEESFLNPSIYPAEVTALHQALNKLS